MFPSNYSKLFRIVIGGRAYFARYYNKANAKRNAKNGADRGTHCGWHIDVPTGHWWFDDTVGNMKREVLAKFPTATFHKIK